MLAVANVVSLIEKRKSADSERQYKGANLHPSQDSKFSYRPNEHVIRCLNFFFFLFFSILYLSLRRISIKEHNNDVLSDLPYFLDMETDLI